MGNTDRAVTVPRGLPTMLGMAAAAGTGLSAPSRNLNYGPPKLGKNRSSKSKFNHGARKKRNKLARKCRMKNRK